MPDDSEPELEAHERDALAAWQPTEPPAGFADRVAAEPAAAPAVIRPERRRRWIAMAAVLAAALAIGGVGFAIVRGSDDAPGGPSAGAVTADVRRSLQLGTRAVAVAEPGAVLAWTISKGKARVEQGAGSVFYRVDHGGPFVVATPLGEVTVTGTCFRVEVIMTGSKQTLVGGAIGAALAAAVVVTVYEGGVVVAGGKGSTKVGPGEHATLTSDGTASVGPTVADVAPPAADVTRDQLLARDELQRQRIAGLTSRVGQLERELASAGRGATSHYPSEDTADGRAWFDPTPEQLAAFAKNCEVRFDMPPITDSEPFNITAERGAEYGLTDAERDVRNQVIAELHQSWFERIRAIYVDVGGEAGATDGLSAQAMMTEIEDKSPRDERRAIQARIAQERAGLVPAPADWSHASPIERMMRS